MFFIIKPVLCSKVNVLEKKCNIYIYIYIYIERERERERERGNFLNWTLLEKDSVNKFHIIFIFKKYHRKACSSHPNMLYSNFQLVDYNLVYKAKANVG